MKQRAIQNAVVFLCAAGVLLTVYWGALWGGQLMDDDNLIFESSVMHGPGAVARMWGDVRATSDFYPLTHMSWWLDFRMSELLGMPEHVNVIIHVENVLLHAVSAMLVWMIARRLGMSVMGGVLAAGVFAVHPVQVESVAWMSQRKNVLSGVLYLLSAYGYVRGVLEGTDAERGKQSGEGRMRGGWYGFALGMFACALFAKPRVMTLAGSLVVLAWWKGGAGWKRRAAWAIPFFGLALPMAIWTMEVQLEHVGTNMEDFQLTLAERLVVSGKVFMFSIWKVIWPVELSFAYPRWANDPGRLADWLALLGTAAFFAAAWGMVKRAGRGPLAVLAHFYISLSPSLGFVSILWHRYYWTTDHEQYLGLMGAGIFAGGVLSAWTERRTEAERGERTALGADATRAGAGRGTERKGDRRMRTKTQAASESHTRATQASDEARAEERRRRTGWGAWAGGTAGGLLLTCYVVLSQRQARVYNNAIDLWEDVLRKDDRSKVAYRSLAKLYQDAGQHETAVARAEAGIAAGDDTSEAYLNLSGALARQGKHAEAMEASRRAIAIHEGGRAEQRNPRPGRAHYNLGTALMNLERYEEAAAALRTATALEPGMAEAWYNLGNTYRRGGRRKEALGAYQEAVRVRPEKAEAWVNLGLTYSDLGREAEARSAWERGLKVAVQGSDAERIARQRLGR